MIESEAANLFSLFHTLLFAYQKSLKDILGSGEAVFVHPVLETINTIEKEKGSKIIKGETLDQIFENFSKVLMDAQIVRKAWFEKLGPERYMFHVDGCGFAEPIHALLKPKDVVCPYALIAMSIFQSVTNRKVKIVESEFAAKGTKTLIESKTE